jgi:hypothetical protein
VGISVGGHGEVVGDAFGDGPGLEDVDGHGSMAFGDTTGQPGADMTCSRRQ